MSYQSAFTLNSLMPTLESPGFFADLYNTDPNEISYISSQSCSAQNSRIFQSNHQYLFEEAIQKISHAVETNTKRVAMYEINRFRSLTQSQIMGMATGLVKLRYLMERKVRLVYQKSMIKIGDYGKQRIKQDKKVQRIMESIHGIQLKYYRIELIRTGFQRILKHPGNSPSKSTTESDKISQGIKLMDKIVVDITRNIVKTGTQKIKQFSKERQRLELFMHTLDYIIKMNLNKDLRIAFCALEQQKQKSKQDRDGIHSTQKRTSIDISFENRELETPTVCDIKAPQAENESFPLPIQPISFGVVPLESKQLTTEAGESIQVVQNSEVNLSNPEIKHSQSTPELTKQAIEQKVVQTKEQSKVQEIGWTPQRSIRTMSKASSINDLQCKEISREYEQSVSMSEQSLSKLKEQEPHIPSLKRQSIFDLNQERVSMFKKNPVGDICSPLHSPRDMMRKNIKLTQIKLKQNQIKMEPLGVAINSQQGMAVERKQEQLIRKDSEPVVSSSVEMSTSKPFTVSDKNYHEIVSDVSLDSPFQSFFFAKNHRSNNIYHRHPDLAYQQLGDLADTPQIFHIQILPPSVSKYNYEFKKPTRPSSNYNTHNQYETYSSSNSNANTNFNYNYHNKDYTKVNKLSNYDEDSYFNSNERASTKLSSVKSADNLLNIEKLEKSIYVTDNTMIPSLFPSTPTNDRVRQPRFSDEVNINQQKYNQRASSSRSSKYKQYSTGSEAFEQYLKEKQIEKQSTKNNLNFYYSKVSGMMSPISMQTPKVIETKPIVGTQVFDYFPLANKMTSQNSKHPLPPRSIAHPLDQRFIPTRPK